MATIKHRMIRRLQDTMFPEFVNSDEPRNCKKGIDGIRIHADVRYGQEYPNSYVDIYQSPKYDRKALPVLVYCHGGGYTWGDKAEGDPNAKDQGLGYFKAFLDAGYHVASVNYALAPDFTYPVPLHQLNQCMEYLSVHSSEYGLHMGEVILAGSSAGAHLAGQYINILTNIDYAAEMKIKPVLSGEQILAFVSSSGLLDCERFDRTDSGIFNFLLRKCARAYFGVRRFHGNTVVRQADVIAHMSEDFPPCFLSDGNRGTFTDQAEDMAKRAQALGIPYHLKLYPKDIAVLGHGFELGKTPQAQEVIMETLVFLRDCKERLHD